MDSLNTEHFALIAFIAFGAGILYILHRYRKENNLQAWFHKLRKDAERAVADSEFRVAELAAIETNLANVPKSIFTITIRKNHELFLYLLPKIMMILAVPALGLTYLGLFRMPVELETNWAIYVALFMFFMVGALMLITDALRADYFRIQQLNRKYLLLKAGDERSAMLSTLKELLGHYPGVPELWMEYADQLARSGRVADALTSIEEARRLAPGSMDLVVVELSLRIRNNELDKADKVADQTNNIKRQPGDPRPELYNAALILKRSGNREEAVEYVKKALKLNREFCETIMPRDETLNEVQVIAKEIGA